MDHFCQKCGRELMLDSSLLHTSGDKNPFKKSQPPDFSSPSNMGRGTWKEAARSGDKKDQDDLRSSIGTNSFERKSKSYSGAQVQQQMKGTSSVIPVPGGRKGKHVSLHAQLSAAQNVFRVATELTDVDFPVCVDCMDLLFEEYEALAKQETRESAAHQEFLNDFQQMKLHSPSEDELKKEILALEAEEAKLLRMIDQVEKERSEFREEMEKVKFESGQLDLLEDRFYEDFNCFLVESHEFEERKDALLAKMNTATGQLQHLERTDVLNDVFHIWHDGHFGTINDFRLGRLPSQPVEWNEINAGWGQACHLLSCISRKLKYNFTQHLLIPQGSFSRVVRLDDGSQYELYGSNDISFGRLLRDRRFDTAMVAFLKCLKEVCDHVNQTDPGFEVPYVIDKERVGGLNIKTHFNNDVQWTKALKYMLIDLKMLLAWVNKHDQKNEGALQEQMERSVK